MHNKININKKELIAVLVIIAVSVILLLVTNLTSHKGKTAVIKVDNKIIKEIPLSDNRDGFTVDGIGGVAFEVRDGRICVKENDCPDKICVRTGYISDTDERIICMPKKLIVEIK